MFRHASSALYQLHCHLGNAEDCLGFFPLSSLGIFSPVPALIVSRREKRVQAHCWQGTSPRSLYNLPARM